MEQIQLKNNNFHQAFKSSNRPHILMITNHGVHEWHVVPGLPDTGGQNIYVNQFSAALTHFGYRITIANRGGYPHPVTGKWQRGLHYLDEYQRLLYLEDSLNEFIRKEDMHGQIPTLVKALENFFEIDGTAIDLIISHYWDGASIGVQFNNKQPYHIPHYWIPHSLGILKKRNVTEQKWSSLRIDERIRAELALIPKLDGIAATSSKIQETLREDYGYISPNIFLPPCVDAARYHPREINDADPIWQFLSQRSGLSQEQVRRHKIITEISRTDTTKRKDVLIKAFARTHEAFPNSLLVISIDDRNKIQAKALRTLIGEMGLSGKVVAVGSIWDILPTLYAVSDIYCTPSIMEGFGMSAQEAAATSVPVISSDLVPYVCEYLLGSEPEKYIYSKFDQPILVGEGAIVVQADDVNGFAQALMLLLTDDELRSGMGQKAYHATIPYFTWGFMVERFLKIIRVDPAISGAL